MRISTNGPHADSNRIGKYAALQSFSEIGLGSIFHSLQVPLGGHFLSLNQGLILILASRKQSGRASAVGISSSVSGVSAFMKALSPAGKRVMPMLAIAMQGFLFSAGVGLFGLNVLGMIVGMILLSLWGFVQPLLTAYLFFGQTFFLAIQKLWLGIAESLKIPAQAGYWILLGAVGIKIVLAMVVAVASWTASDQFESRYGSWVEKAWSKAGVQKAPLETLPPLKGSLLDLLRPWFIISFTLCVTFVVLTSEPAWGYVVRTLSSSWLFFYGVRAFPRSWIERLSEKFPSVRSAMDQVFSSRKISSRKISSRKKREAHLAAAGVDLPR